MLEKRATKVKRSSRYYIDISATVLYNTTVLLRSVQPTTLLPTATAPTDKPLSFSLGSHIITVSTTMMMKTTILSLLLAGASAFAPPAAQVRFIYTIYEYYGYSLSLSLVGGFVVVSYCSLENRKGMEQAAGNGGILVPYARSCSEAIS